jgi:plasmid stability protein
VRAFDERDHGIRYTIRGIPSAVDAALRQRARASGKSLNEVAVDALTEAAGIGFRPHKRRDLADVAGTWRADKAIESVLADQDRVGEIAAVSIARPRKRAWGR